MENSAEYNGEALKVEGWMEPNELGWLREQALTHPVIIEIGSWKGRSATALAEGCPGVLFLVDNFQGSSPEENANGFKELWQQGGRANVINTLLNNMRIWIDAGKVFLIEAPSVDAALSMQPILRHHPPNMFFIDGDHSYAGCASDILAWRRFFKTPGLICGHDWGWPGVRQAIDEFVPGWQAGPGAIWFKPDFQFS